MKRLLIVAILLLSQWAGATLMNAIKRGGAPVRDAIVDAGKSERYNRSGLAHILEEPGFKGGPYTKLTVNQIWFSGVNDEQFITSTILSRTDEVSQVRYNVPSSTVPPASSSVGTISYFESRSSFGNIGPKPWIETHGGGAVEKVEHPGVIRRYRTVGGEVEEGMAFEVTTDIGNGLPMFRGKPVRVQEAQTIKSENLELIATRTQRGPGDEIKIYMKVKANGKEEIYRASPLIPDKEGWVIGFHVNANGTKLSVWTSLGNKIEYSIHPVAGGADGSLLNFSRRASTKLTDAELQGFLAQQKIIPKSKAVSAPAGDMSIEPGSAGAQ